MEHPCGTLFAHPSHAPPPPPPVPTSNLHSLTACCDGVPWLQLVGAVSDDALLSAAVRLMPCVDWLQSALDANMEHPLIAESALMVLRKLSFPSDNQVLGKGKYPPPSQSGKGLC